MNIAHIDFKNNISWLIFNLLINFIYLVSYVFFFSPLSTKDFAPSPFIPQVSFVYGIHYEALQVKMWSHTYILSYLMCF